MNTFEHIPAVTVESTVLFLNRVTMLDFKGVNLSFESMELTFPEAAFGLWCMRKCIGRVN